MILLASDRPSRLYLQPLSFFLTKEKYNQAERMEMSLKALYHRFLGKMVEMQRVHVWLWLALITWVKHSLKFILDKTYKYKLQLHFTDHYLLSA